MANESEMNLGLALGGNQQQVEVESSGAGANANSNSNSNSDKKTFVRPGPLTELVWSSQNGLSIKCAGCTTCFAHNNPSCLFTDQKYKNVGEMKCGHFKGKEKESSKSITSEVGPHNQTTAHLLPLLATQPEILETKTQNIDRLGLDIGLPLKIQEPYVKRDEDNSKESPEKMEETAENDIQDLNAAILVQNREESCKQNSHGSMESCNSANLSSKGNNKRLRFEQQLIIGSKRIKNQSQESTPVVKQDSSFMNWISNMVKGIKPCQEEGHSALALSIGHPIDDDHVTKKLGFQTVFHSLYSQDAKRLETRTRVENKSSKEIILFDKTVSNHDPVDFLNQKAIGNLWIARFSPKTPPSTLSSSNNSDPKSFVRLKESKTSCLFCGKRGHEIGECLEIKNEKEVEGYLKKIRLYGGVSKEASCLCIKCFQLNHWASECPSEERWSDLKLKLNEIPKHPGSSSGKIPKEMLETIRRLRLSRTDILK